MSQTPLPTGGDRPLSVLVITPDVPPADRDAGSLRLFRLLELLVADGHRVHLLARLGVGQEPAALALERLGIETVRADPQRLPEAQRAQVDAPAVDVPGLLRRLRPDVVWMSFHDVAEAYLPLVRRHAPGARVIVDTVDVHFVREARAAALSGRPADHERAAHTRAREAATYAAADALVAVSADDGAALAELAPGVPVHVIATIHAAEEPGPAFDARHGVVFVGNFRHAPNVDAVVHFVTTSWPLVRDALPGARLTLVGTAPPAEVQALAGPDVAVTGWVPETRPHLDAARVSVAPLRYGAGVKGKIGEAMACGLPVVTTTIGAEGMGLVDGEHALVADDPAQLAAAVVALHTDAGLWGRLADAGRARLAAALSPAVAHRALRALLADAAPQLFVATSALEDEDVLDATLGGYLDAFDAGDAVSLVVPVREGRDPQVLFAALARALDRLGHDPEHIPDIALVAWAQDAVLPAAALEAPAATWRVPPQPSRGPGRTPAAAIVVRLPEDAAAAATQVDALARARVADDVEIVLVAAEDAGLDAVLASASGARVVRIGAHLGRRAAWQRAAAATRAPTIVMLEPHALPRPGFAAPLLDAISAGAALAGPVVAGAHGLRVAADGALWPLADATTAPDALAMDCLAAARGTWLDAPAVLPSREGHAEAQLAAWAAARGPLTVAPGARVGRAPAPEASVLICTRNRAEELEDAVGLLVASGARDVVVVDNASTDATPEVAARLAAAHPGVVRVVVEERGGLGHARNAAAAAARHDLLLYLDDDARPAPGWAAAAARELARPGVANVGGPIAALWPPERPADWPAPGLEPLLSVLDLGDADRTLVPPDVVYGANWGVRRSALDAAGGFDPAFGVGPDVRIGGDEVSVAWRLHRAGLGATRYVAAAAVGHRIDPARISEPFLTHRAMACGIERARHAAALDGIDRGRLMGTASAAAGRLLRLIALSGDLRLEQAFDVVAASTLDPRLRIVAADALGELSGSVLLLGETEVRAAGLRLLLAPEHLRAVLRPAVAA
ncbi:glycosyltransferase [Baekduia soli]|uniref:Glycosyltransferase n=1 Tax=Baekduia soli TaxID=496014 RepID=A0A5B8U1L5_9ACTN|nr:glycosyltransferase [Baekduia soli]QEC46876.1 glycosyltransferase [Baekduia soli]